jgi:hypothetical protein
VDCTPSVRHNEHHSLAQPMEAEFACRDESGKPQWATCQVVGVKDKGMRQNLVIALGEHGLLGAFEVDEVIPVTHRGLRHIEK